MAKRETTKTKPVRLPAIGKPKPKVKKSSIKAMGARAAKDYMVDPVTGGRFDTDSEYYKLHNDLQAGINRGSTKKALKADTPKTRQTAYRAMKSMARKTGV